MKHKLLILCIVCLVLAGCAGGVGGDLGHSHDLDSEDHHDRAHDDGDEKAHHTDDGEDEDEKDEEDEGEEDEEDEDEEDEDEEDEEDEDEEGEEDEDEEDEEDEDEEDDSYWILHSTVSIKNKAFGPQTLTAEWVEERGGSCFPCPQITWVNNDDKPHTITSDTGEFDSGPIGPGEQWMWTFIKAGTYDYHCTYHEEMTGTIEIVEVEKSSG